MADETDIPAEGADPLKYYCIVFGVIVVALAVMYVKVNGDRDDYERANADAKRYLTADGVGPGRDGRPQDILHLAADVERFSGAYKIAGGDDAGGGISFEKMKSRATQAQMMLSHTSAPIVDTNQNRRFQTTSQKFTYDPADLGRFVRLIYNIESEGRLRVSEIQWQLRPESENQEKPYNKIQKSTIQVSVRGPLARSGP
jgi:hypothetical protein